VPNDLDVPDEYAASIFRMDAKRTGRGDIRPFYEDASTRFPELRTTVVQTVSEGNWVVAEWDAIMVGPTGDELHLAELNGSELPPGGNDYDPP
jgi:hypothetical protein